MSADTITPARLRELASRHENDAGYYAQRRDNAGETVALETAAALRAAADTLAAREALLKRVGDMLEKMAPAEDRPGIRALARALAAEIAAALKETDNADADVG